MQLLPPSTNISQLRPSRPSHMMQETFYSRELSGICWEKVKIWRWWSPKKSQGWFVDVKAKCYLTWSNNHDFYRAVFCKVVQHDTNPPFTSSSSHYWKILCDGLLAPRFFALLSVMEIENKQCFFVEGIKHRAKSTIFQEIYSFVCIIYSAHLHWQCQG